MDFSDFKARLARAREFEVEAGGIKFRLRMPPEHAWRLALEDSKGPEGRFRQQRVSRSLLEQALIGWEGLLAKHLLPGEGDEVVPFSAEAVPVLLDERPDIADQLVLSLTKRMNERRAELEAARKNSRSASSGT